MRSDLAKDIKRFFENTDAYHTITGDTDLLRDVGMDSLRLAAFIAYLEQLRKAKIDVATLVEDDIRTINAIIRKYFHP